MGVPRGTPSKFSDKKEARPRQKSWDGAASADTIRTAKAVYTILTSMGAEQREQLLQRLLIIQADALQANLRAVHLAANAL